MVGTDGFGSLGLGMAELSCRERDPKEKVLQELFGEQFHAQPLPGCSRAGSEQLQAEVPLG